MAEIRPTTWDVWNPIKNGEKLPASTGAGFQPSTVWAGLTKDMRLWKQTAGPWKWTPPILALEKNIIIFQVPCYFFGNVCHMPRISFRIVKTHLEHGTSSIVNHVSLPSNYFLQMFPPPPPPKKKETFTCSTLTPCSFECLKVVVSTRATWERDLCLMVWTLALLPGSLKTMKTRWNVE